MTLSAFDWGLIVGAFALLVGVVGHLIKRDRSSIESSIKGARDEAKASHEQLAGKIDKIEADVRDVAMRQGMFVTRTENDDAHTRLVADQRAERAELRGFLTAWMERIERAIATKADKP